MRMVNHRVRAGAMLAAMLVGLAGLAAAVLPAGAQPGREHGQSIAPVYEGYIEKPDGSYDLLFGYLNRNWVEHPVLEIGPDNHIEPRGPDLGQPTHFFPRRSRFVFRVPVPADFGANEVVWTLTANGVTAQAFGTLRQGYAVDDTVLMANFGGGGPGGFHPDTLGNTPPELAVETARELTATVGEPFTLRAVASDDGIPPRRPIPSFWIGRSRTVCSRRPACGCRGSATAAPHRSRSTRRRRRSGRTSGTAAARPGRPAGSRRPSRPTTAGWCGPRSMNPEPMSSAARPTTADCRRMTTCASS